MSSINEEKIQKGARRFYPNIYYHVYNRGNHRELIYHQEADYYKFLELLRVAELRTAVEIYGYCLMPNHYHLLLRLGSEEDGITKFIHRSMTGYVMYFNHKYETVGRLFQSRYQYRYVFGDIELYRVKKYLQDNPVKAGLAKESEEYRWLSIYEG